MALYSPNYYRIVYAWYAENYATEGILFCQVFIKNNQSLSDPLLIQLTNGTKRTVLGTYLFSTPKLAMEYVNKIRDAEILALNTQLQSLQKKMSKTKDMYGRIYVEPDPRIV